MKNFLTLLLLGFFTIPLAFASIEVQDTQGRKMTVDVLAYTESSGNVRIKRVEDGAIFNVKLNIFDSDSQERIREAAPKQRAKLDVSVSVARRRQDVPGSSYMERQTIKAKAKVENASRDIDFIEGKATLLLVGREMKRFANRDADYGEIMHKESFNATLNPGREMEYEFKPIVTEYDSDKDSTNIGGIEYYGWLLVIQEKDGSIHSVETSIGNLKKETDEDPEIGNIFLGLNVGQSVEKDLSKRKD